MSPRSDVRPSRHPSERSAWHCTSVLGIPKIENKSHPTTGGQIHIHIAYVLIWFDMCNASNCVSKTSLCRCWHSHVVHNYVKALCHAEEPSTNEQQQKTTTPEHFSNQVNDCGLWNSRRGSLEKLGNIWRASTFGPTFRTIIHAYESAGMFGLCAVHVNKTLCFTWHYTTRMRPMLSTFNGHVNITYIILAATDRNTPAYENPRTLWYYYCDPLGVSYIRTSTMCGTVGHVRVTCVTSSVMQNGMGRTREKWWLRI